MNILRIYCLIAAICFILAALAVAEFGFYAVIAVLGLSYAVAFVVAAAILYGELR